MDDDASTKEEGLPERYDDLGRISRGGSAEVRRVFDRVLGRAVAMKILRWEHLDSPERRGRFLNEARITAQLEHPGIVPLHDQGVLRDGRPWFTMKEIRGRTLDETLAGGSVSEPGARRRLVDVLLRVCEAVAYAHDHQIVHRDLKPANLMLGPFGEVWVLDWGIARDMRAVAEPQGDARLPDGELATEASETRAGDVLGTIAYMSPEQARGAVVEVGPASDVWALGIILFEILTGQRAFSGDVGTLWAQISEGRSPPIPDALSVPEELVSIYQHAVCPSPSDRYPSAVSLRDALNRWLDGEVLRARARLLVRAARGLQASLDLLEVNETEARDEAGRLRSQLHDFDPVDRKLPMWELEDRAAQLQEERAALEAEQIERLRAALQHDPECEEAHAALAGVYRRKCEEAEARGAGAEVARYEHLLKRHDRGAHRAFLEGRGALTLHTIPPARAVAHRLRLVRRRLISVEAIELGTTPIDARELAAGSYIVSLLAEGREPVRYPVRIGRDTHHDGRPPGAATPFPIGLPPAGALSPSDIYVPAGNATLGGDPLAAEPIRRKQVWIDGFVIKRFPVTVEEYLAFLNDLARAGRTADAERVAPRLARGTVHEGTEALAVARDADGRFVFLPDEHGRAISPTWPVCNVDWYAAQDYCRWHAERTGQPWRLPNELEWEKTARGCDERAFPWGNEPEPTWACILGSTPDAPSRVDVTEHELDESPYGARGLAGNVRDWCANVWRPDGPPTPRGRLDLDLASGEDEGLRSIRGGAWQTVPAFARAAGRFASAPGDRFAVLGFRLARSYDGG